LRIIEFIDRSISRIETLLLIILLSVMIIVGFLQVILRNLFSTGILWADAFLRHIVLWITFIGASLATREDRHINIDVLTRFLSPRLRRFVGLITNLFASGICFLMLRASIVFIRSELEFPQRIFLGLKTWMVELVIPICFGIMGLRFILRGFRRLIEGDFIEIKR
jgi:TRAP-type C4-dicarboxylate transport system permease small subunit